MSKSVCDSIIVAAWVVPIEPQGPALAEHAVAVSDGMITAIGSAADITAHWTAKDRVDLPHHILLPGLVNAHGHVAMTLLRGLADDLPMNQWLTEHIWPLEGQWVDPEFVRDGVTLGLLEMLGTGTTCFSDMYFFPEVAAACAREAGVRAQIAFPIVRFPNAWSRDSNEAFHKGLGLHDEYRDDPLINVAFGPHAPNTVTAEDLTRTLTLADELEAQIQIHLHETAEEVSAARERLRMTHIEWLAELGLLIPRLQAVHMTQVSQVERELIADSGAAVIHCPNSNLKLGSGICDTTALRELGVPVGLGTDGAASNNSLDMFTEMRAAALLAKTARDDVTAGDATSVLRMATIESARALGLDRHIGSLEPGKRADLIAVSTKNPALSPLHHAVSQLVYTGAGAHVSHVWIDGTRVVADGICKTLDPHRVLANAQRWVDRLHAPEAQLQLL